LAEEHDRPNKLLESDSVVRAEDGVDY
jgi:hypothetical protein